MFLLATVSDVNIMYFDCGPNGLSPPMALCSGVCLIPGSFLVRVLLPVRRVSRKRLYWVLDEISMTRDQILEEALKVEGRTAVTDPTALMGEDSVFGAFDFGLGDKATQSMADSFAIASSAPAEKKQKKDDKPPRAGEDSDADTVTDDPMDEAIKLVDKIIEQSCDSRTLSVKVLLGRLGRMTAGEIPARSFQVWVTARTAKQPFKTGRHLSEVRSMLVALQACIGYQSRAERA